MSERFDRQMRFFGKEGQERLTATRVAVVGVGGLGTHVVQQLASLGIGGFDLIDSEELAITDRNRYVGVRHDDPIPGTRKVDIGERIIKEIYPRIPVDKIHDSLVSEQAFEAVICADYVFGCLDCEGARLILNELCASYSRPYFDLASDTRALALDDRNSRRQLFDQRSQLSLEVWVDIHDVGSEPSEILKVARCHGTAVS